MSAARATQVPADADLPEADVLDGALHPRFAPRVIGQEQAETAMLDALGSGRMHHAWLVTGPKGVGKASFAWRAARYLLTAEPDSGSGLFGDPEPPASLDTDPEHPVVRRVLALSEPRIMLIRRLWNSEKKSFQSEITVDSIRGSKTKKAGLPKLKGISGFLSMSVPDGGRRVVLVDAADDMNANAANALLKQLEEPPENTVFLLISHRPSRLLPTIRSRCRTLRCGPLGPDDLTAALAGQEVALPDGATAQALAALSGGSVGRAIQLLQGDGLLTYGRLVRLATGLPDFDRQEAIALAEWAANRTYPDRFDLTVDLLETLLARLARAGVAGPPETEAAEGEAVLMRRLSPGLAAAQGWAAAQDSLGARLRTGRAVNLDPAALILDTILEIAATAKDRLPA